MRRGRPVARGTKLVKTTSALQQQTASPRCSHLCEGLLLKDVERLLNCLLRVWKGGHYGFFFGDSLLHVRSRLVGLRRPGKDLGVLGPERRSTLHHLEPLLEEDPVAQVHHREEKP